MASWLPFNWGRSAKGAPPSTQAPVERGATANDATTASTAIPTAEKASETPAAISSAATDSSLFSRRSMRQLSIFFGGAGLLALSVMVSRRAVIRHSIASRLRFYEHSYFQASKEVEKSRKDPAVAFEALNLATLNVASFAIMAAGGASFAFDISSLEELRQRARRAMFEGTSNIEADAEAERQVAEWVSKVLKISIPEEASADKKGKKQDGDKSSVD